MKCLNIDNSTLIKKMVLALLLIGVVLFAFGQEYNDYNQRLYQAYIGDEMDLWKEIISEMDREYAYTDNPALLYDLCFAYYGFIGYLISEEQEKEAKEVLVRAMKKTEVLEKVFDGSPDVLALNGAMIGYRLVLSKFSAMFLGPKAFKYIKKAYESTDDCFNCNVEMGNMKFYTPKIFGGSKTEAIPHYEKAVALLENSELKTDRNWIYINTVLLLANAYRETDQQELACRLYKQLLEYEPAADWIRKDLYSKCRTP